VKFAVAGFFAGVIVTWLLMTYGPPQPVTNVDRNDEPTATPNQSTADGRPPEGSRSSRPKSTATTGVIAAMPLRVPIDGANVDAFKGGFAERRDGRAHEAIDVLAPRNTPVHAVADGTIAKLFYSKGGGGITLYQFDPAGSVAYYYAHLERYADDIKEGQHVTKGQVIGYVGTSGNAPPNTPHLHFAVFELDADRKWWKGRAIDPYPLFK
jgi:murein DD-endopeptidase MepM/ murein hydrolase activator NlpD